jgi:hypothetical protein
LIDEFFDNPKNLFGNTTDELDVDEFRRIESKHTRIRHDEDLREIIRVH